jgi:SSS family solute:Na+ symporter
MIAGLNWTASGVFVFFFLIVAVLGFLSARWKRGDLSKLDEWGLGGRRFGVLVTWFLLGGDFYTAYTIIAVPGYVFGAGAIGFFALPYTILVYPFVFAVMPRLWLVSKRHNYITLADFARGRYGSRTLALVIAVTGVLATLPYVALQLVGMQVTIEALGLRGSGFVNDLPLIVAFLILAAFAYTSGLRAPASIAIVKDVMVYVFVLAAVIWIPPKFGGFAHIFNVAGQTLALHPAQGALILPASQRLPFATLALGSALAAFLYPHTATGTLSSSSAAIIKRNAVLLPIYTLLLGLLATLGYVAMAADVKVSSTNDVLPSLLLKAFPSWFVGFSFAAIAIGALVPAAIMAIAASNLFTRNIYREYIRPQIAPKEEAAMAKLVAVLVIFGALAFVIFGQPSYAIVLQLLGGIWILQTFPAIILGLFVRWFHPQALLAGWLTGMVCGTAMAWSLKLKSAVFPLHVSGTTLASYAAIDALIVNLAVATAWTALLERWGADRGSDETVPADYVETPSGPGLPGRAGCEQAE